MNYPGASMSSCGLYRYALWRDWSMGGDLFSGKKGRRVCWIMLNPSTADAETDDPTIRRCIGFSKAWGYDGMLVVNLFAYRATKPADMLAADDPVGPENDKIIQEAARSSLTALVVCAWGANAPEDRAAHALRLIREAGATPHALRLTKSDAPAHPLYLPKTSEPFAMDEAGER